MYQCEVVNIKYRNKKIFGAKIFIQKREETCLWPSWTDSRVGLLHPGF